jgi:hypothetical protein
MNVSISATDNFATQLNEGEQLYANIFLGILREFLQQIFLRNHIRLLVSKSCMVRNSILYQCLVLHHSSRRKILLRFFPVMNFASWINAIVSVASASVRVTTIVGVPITSAVKRAAISLLIASLELLYQGVSTFFGMNSLFLKVNTASSRLHNHRFH